jgi:hypothetical protein
MKYLWLPCNPETDRSRPFPSGYAEISRKKYPFIAECRRRETIQEAERKRAAQETRNTGDMEKVGCGSADLGQKRTACEREVISLWSASPVSCREKLFHHLS